MAKRRKRQVKSSPVKAPVSPESRLATWRMQIELTALDLARGHDGLLRGAPEPVVLFAAFLLDAARPPKPLGRAFARFAPKDRFPAVIPPIEKAVIRGRARSNSLARVVLLGIALEEDSGKDIERVYARLSDGKGLRVWEPEDAIPAPAAIGELTGWALSPAPHSARVHVVEEGADLQDICKEDELIGACAIVLAPRRSEERYYLGFTSPDGKNDWTASLDVRID